MILEIITPEAIILSTEVSKVAVPGVTGGFQMLDNHAPVVSLLQQGNVRFSGNNIVLDEAFENKFTKEGEDYILAIDGGTIEMNNNKVILLAD